MVAVKVESCTSNKQVLKIEAVILKRLQDLPHTCELHGCGRTDKVNFIVMTLLGQNLSDLRKKQAKQVFTTSTVLRLAVQSIMAVQEMHNCGFLHRDIKPSNFAMGIGDQSRKCFLIDFGLARQYTTPTGELKQPRPTAGFRGTVRYASINAHLGIELGRHDDLWSVFYMLIELATGNLPWRRIREKEEAGKAKQECNHDNLIKGLPEEFKLFMNHLQKLSYHDKPDYQYLVNLFEQAQSRLGISESDPFDWESDFILPSANTASASSQQIVSPEHQNTAEHMDSLKAKSIGEKVKKICKVFQTMNSPKTTHGTSVNNKRNTSNSQKMSVDNKIGNMPAAESNINNNNSNKMELENKDVADNDCNLSNCGDKLDPIHLQEDVPVAPTDELDGHQPKKGFTNVFNDSADDNRSHHQTMTAERQVTTQLNTGFMIMAGEILKDDTLSSSSDDGQPHLKRKFERVDSPLIHRIGTDKGVCGSGEGRSGLVGSLNAPVERTELLTSSLNTGLPKPPSDPPRNGYFCSSARKRKFVKLSRRILANSLRQE